MKIVFLDVKTLGDVDLKPISELGDLTAYDVTSGVDETVLRIGDAEVVITNKVVVDKYVMERTSNLKLICVAATGTNNIDLEAAKERGIAVTNVAGYSTESVAQHTFALLFYVLEHLRYFDSYVKSKSYCASDMFTHHGRSFWEINGKTWGIIGLGTIGRRVADIASCFGCRVVYYSTSGVERKEKYPRVDLDELLEMADIISIHAPLNDKTRNLITYNELKKMKKTAILLNLGRGGIVNEHDLARALDEGLISGCGLDVLEKEPPDFENPLLNIKNKERLFITPHIAWASREARERLVREIAENIKAFYKGESRNRVV